jgi:UDP-N-acetylmuramoylalanine--D-glutamate ligase
MKRTDFTVAGKEVVVVGAGRSGAPAAELLVARGAKVTLADTNFDIDRGPELRGMGIALELGRHLPETFAKADLIVLSPGVPPDQEAIAAARKAGVPVIAEIELASRWLQGRMIAITGTKGKSTTTTLTARMLQNAGLDAPAGGNLGPALSSQVAASQINTTHVVEVSSFQLEGTDQFHPWIAVLLNLSPDHLDRHASYEEYRDAKARIFANQTSDDWAVINVDDAEAAALAAARSKARRFDFGMDGAVEMGVTIEDDAVVHRSGSEVTKLFDTKAVRVPGRHLLSDVLAAVSVGVLTGVPAEVMEKTVEDFRGLEHALEPVAEINGVRFVNDSKATNLASAKRSIESFENHVVLILGGRYKGGDFRDLADVLRERGDAVIAIGEAQRLIHQALDDVLPVRDARSMKDAVELGASLAKTGGVVLLAPACSSFDMFKDYAARGDEFRAEVRRLEGAMQ